METKSGHNRVTLNCGLLFFSKQWLVEGERAFPTSFDARERDKKS